jgi:Uma2 family endonuclease
MSIAAKALEPPEAYDETGIPLMRLSVDQYHRMIDAGILNEDDPVELLQGLLVTKMPKKPLHSVATDDLREQLGDLLPAGWCVRAQDPITTSDSEPEPDIVVARGKRRDYRDRHPGPKDIGMLAEVSDKTLRYDRTIKKGVYAAARIPIYWIVNLPEKQVEVYTGPSGPGKAPDYAKRRVYGIHESVPVVLRGKKLGQIAVKDMIP